MYAILSPDIALRSWTDVPFAYYRKFDIRLFKVSKEEFSVLLRADGMHDLEDDELTCALVEKGLIQPCEKGEAQLDPWQKMRRYANRATPKIGLQVTQRCNLNCLHCFNAVDSTAPQAHPSLNQIIGLLDQARDCGVNALCITGGEPFIRKDIRDIITAIYERGMYVFEFCTNGYFLDDETLDFLESLGGPTPLMKISFDGIGYHDIMRAQPGAEEDALRAIKLCISRGFRVMVHVNANADNLHCLPETLDMLDTMGVTSIRVIRTTDAPRWKDFGGKSLGITEYYDGMIDLVSKHVQKPRTAELVIWQFFYLYPQEGIIQMIPTMNTGLDQPICKDNCKRIEIGANGNAYPCLPASGGMDAMGIFFGNVFETSLHEVLKADSDFMRHSYRKRSERVACIEECRNCEYLPRCGGGCPVLGLLTSLISDSGRGWDAPDLCKCAFFKGGYEEKLRQALMTDR